jgi:predicted permease
MISVLREFRLATRRLMRDGGFTLASLLTMTVGIGAAATVFALVDGVLLRPLPYPESERLVSVGHVASGIDLPRDGVSAGVFLHYRDRNRVFEGMGAYESVSFTFTDAGRPDRVKAALVTPELFSVLRLAPAIGRVPSAADDMRDASAGTGSVGILISHDLWVGGYQSAPDILGRAIEINGEPWAVVTGVAPEGFVFPDASVQAWIAMPQEHNSWSARAEVRHAMFLNGVARLRPGVTLAEADADLNRLAALLPEVFPDITAEELREFGLRAEVRPFKETIVGEVRTTLLLVLASAGFLLLVTWANVANLLLTRTHGRRAEIGITRALGATERSVAGRLLAESLLLAMAGGLLGLAVAWLAIGVGLGFAPDQLPRLDQVAVDGVVVGLVVTLAVLSGTLMGVICLVSTRRGVAGPALAALQSRSSTQRREGQTGGRALVAAQMALALTLLIGSGLMARTFWRLQKVDLGFQTEGRLTFYMPVTHLSLDASHQDYAALHAEVMGRLRAVPGVDAVEAATASVFPLTIGEYGRESLTTILPGDAASNGNESWPLAEYGYATPEYFQAMGIPILAGRTFNNGDAVPGALGAILSESLARDLFPDANPIGQTVAFGEFRSFWPTHTIVGVVGDIMATTIREGRSRAIYIPHIHPLAPEVSIETLHPYLPRFEMYAVRASTDLMPLVPALRQAIRDVDPRLPMLDVASLKSIVSDATAQERFTLRLLLVSAATALFLGVVGVYGVLAYSVRRRTAEIGVRLALGASPARVTRLIVSQGAMLSMVGIVIGLIASLLLTGFIESLLYETSPTDPVTFAGVTLMLFGVALAASYLPARRASRVDPVRAIRAD